MYIQNYKLWFQRHTVLVMLNNMQTHSKKQPFPGKYKHFLPAVNLKKTLVCVFFFFPQAEGKQVPHSRILRLSCGNYEHISATTHDVQPLIISYTKQNTEVILQDVDIHVCVFNYVVHVLITNCSTLLTCTTFLL